jgi:hypothetical protein
MIDITLISNMAVLPSGRVVFLPKTLRTNDPEVRQLLKHYDGDEDQFTAMCSMSREEGSTILIVD